MQTDIQEFLWVAVPKISGATVQLVLNFLLMRSLGPEQFGIFAVCLSMILLADGVLGAAFDTAVLRQAPLYAEDRLRALQVQQAALLLKPLCGVLAIVPLLAASGPINMLLFQGRGSKTLLYLSAASMLGLLMLRSVQTHFQVDRRFHGYGATDLLHNAVRFGGAILLVSVHAATPGRVLALYAAAPLVIALGLLGTTARPLLFARFSAGAVTEVLRLIKSYLPTAAVGSATTRMDVFFVTGIATVGQAGIFAAAQTLAVAPQLIGMYLGVVFSPRIMPLWKADKLRPLYHRFQRLAIVGSCACYALALLTMGWFISVVMPASFRGATLVTLVLLPTGLVGLVNFPWTVSLLLFLRPRFLLMFDLLALPLLAVLYALAVSARGAVGAAAITTVYALLKTVALQITAKRILELPAEAAATAPIQPNVALSAHEVE